MNISVPDDLAERVRALDLPISAVCQAALKTAVDNAELSTEQITVPTGDDYNINESFTGRWLVAPDERETRTGEDGWDAGTYWGVALTKRGRIAVYAAHCNYRAPGTLTDFDTLKDAAKVLPEDIYALAAAELGENHVIIRDI